MTPGGEGSYTDPDRPSRDATTGRVNRPMIRFRPVSIHFARVSALAAFVMLALGGAPVKAGEGPSEAFVDAATTDTATASEPATRVVVASLAALETALTMAYIDIGYLVALEELNDLGFTTQPSYDYIDLNGGPFRMPPTLGLFLPRAPVSNSWFGPYSNFQQGQTQTATLPYDRGSPLDPWGNPFLLFSPLGLVRGDTGVVTQEFYGDWFDRYALVSLGPDGTMSGDDIVRLFGGGVSGSLISSLSGSNLVVENAATGTSYTATAGRAITIKGYSLGASQGASRVMWGTTEFPGPTAWSQTSITVEVPLGVFGVQDLRVDLGGSVTNALRLTVPANHAGEWEIYE